MLFIAAIQMHHFMGIDFATTAIMLDSVLYKTLELFQHGLPLGIHVTCTTQKNTFKRNIRSFIHVMHS